jgi:KaiC/GvpD/RAD55 family RecA-like ATPase
MEWFLIKAVVDGVVGQSILSEVDVWFFSEELDRKVWGLLRKAFEKGKLVRSWDDLYVFVLRESAGDDVLQRVLWYKESDVDLSSELVLDTVDKLWKEKVLVDGVKRIEEKLLRGVDIDSVVDELGRVYRSIMGKSVVKVGLREEILDGVLDRMVGYVMEEKEERRLLSGFVQLDAVLGGGFRQGSLVVWVGATSVGKTMMLVFQAVMYMLQGKNVLYISLEDSRDVVLERFDRLLFLNVRNDVEGLRKRIELLRYMGKVEVMYMARMEVDELEGLIEGLADEVDVLIVDYGDLLSVGKGRRDVDWVEQGEVFERMMRIADKYNKWVVTASQANREALDRKVLSLGNVSRSFRKVQVADYVIALSQTKEEDQQGLIRLVVLKNKFGKRGDVISLRVIRECGYFREEGL